MVDKDQEQKATEGEDKPKRVKVGKLELNKETVQDLGKGEMHGVRGGQSGGCGGSDGCDSAWCR